MDGNPRMRVFAGPNGSGKSTVKNRLNKPAAWFGIYVNADEIEASIGQSGILDLSRFQVSSDTDELQRFLQGAEILSTEADRSQRGALRIEGDCIPVASNQQSPYLAAALAEFIRELCLNQGKTFTFETVMSHESKLETLRRARQRGFRRYLYYVATDDPAINVQRVAHRTATGGHNVATDKIIARYHRSLALVPDAIRLTERSFFFDTSRSESWHFGYATDGGNLELTSDTMPSWFLPIWDSF